MCLKDCTKDGSSGLAKVKLVATNFPKEKPIINIVDVLQPLTTEGAPTIKQERTPPPPVSRASVSPTIEMQKTKSRRELPFYFCKIHVQILDFVFV